METRRCFIVDEEVLPDIFIKVLQAKSLLAQGKAKNFSEAAAKAGVSRSAFYRYKDHVHLYDQNTSSDMITLYIVLTDEPGNLSNVLNVFSLNGANILTINQTIPADGAATVSVTFRTGGLLTNLDSFIEEISGQNGVVKVRRIST